MLTSVIKRGILQSFDPTTYTASVLFFEATSFALTGIAMANHIDGTSAIIGALCAVLFFDEHNPQDAVIIATFASIPSPPPGRVTFMTGYQQIYDVVIAAGNVQAFSLIGGSSNIPTGVLGVLYKAFFTSAMVGAYIQLAPHGASDITAYASIGNIATANSYIDGVGILAVDASGNIDIKANAGSCTVTLYTYGYIM
ncbi:MAG TPA: hypothetical protein DHW02_04860 [Ktedonobacter sp.]|nr:hypothetical protein [Ktedonobacter sp.]